ncbi:MAG: glutamate--tRNA ligase [Patescibacteria group bacterium]
MVRVRIAPSPTGFAHVGTAYTALFNYAFAKKNKGKFILRVEDTDVKRNVKGAEQAIYEGLAWLGLTWDEGPDKRGAYGPYRQSERLKTYREWADRLLKDGKAYKEEGAVRFKHTDGDVSWDDLVRGRISFRGEEVGDFVLLKSDGYPTYNFGVVIDDILMKITHVIRGEEHISNTPRQIALYQALGEKPPLFAHLPTLRNKERKKLSKRRDPVDLRIFREQGYLPEALVNFLCLLGWSHPAQKEIFSLEEFVKLFDLKRVRPGGPIFDTGKLTWLNGEYVRKTPDAKLAALIFRYLGQKYPLDLIEKTIPLVKERISKLADYWPLAGFFFAKRPQDYSLFAKDYKKHLEVACDVLSELKNWQKKEIDRVLVQAVDANSFKTGDFFMSLRIAITGSRFTPPINDSLAILGQEETIKRLKEVLK